MPVFEISPLRDLLQGNCCERPPHHHMPGSDCTIWDNRSESFGSSGGDPLPKLWIKPTRTIFTYCSALGYFDEFMICTGDASGFVLFIEFQVILVKSLFKGE